MNEKRRALPSIRCRGFRVGSKSYARKVRREWRPCGSGCIMCEPEILLPKFRRKKSEYLP